jgi:hypothetical protein
MGAWRVIAITAVATALGAPATAAASDWYVSNAGNNANACDQAHPCATIQHVVNLVTTVNDDTIHIGPGSFDTASAGIKRLSFAGAGAGTPFIHDPATNTYIDPSASNAFALRMLAGGSVSGINLSGSGNQPGLIMTSSGSGSAISYTVDGVIARGGAISSMPTLPGIVVDDMGSGRTVSAEVNNSTILTFGEIGSQGMLVNGAGRAVVNDSTVQPLSASLGSGVEVTGGGRLAFIHGRIADDFDLRVGISVSAGTVTISRSTIREQGRALIINPGAGGGTALVTVTDSVLANTQPSNFGNAAVVANSGPAGSRAALNLRASTLVVRGAEAFSALGIGGSPDPAALPTTATAVNTVLQAINTGGQPASDVTVNADPNGAPASFSATGSNFSSVAKTGSGTGTDPGTGTNLTGDPDFASVAAGDYRLAPGSPLVDRADLDAVGLGELDLDGGPRSVDGNGDCIAAPDMGAFERPEVACVTSQPSGGTTPSPSSPSPPPAAVGPDLVAADIESFGLERTRFAVGPGATAVAARKRVARGSAFRYTISEDATTRILIERAAKGLRSGRRCVKPTAKLRKRRAKRCVRYTRAGTLTRAANQGANRHPFSGRIGRRALKPGRYRATITAADAAGNVSGARTAKFVIVK